MASGKFKDELPCTSREGAVGEDERRVEREKKQIKSLC